MVYGMASMKNQTIHEAVTQLVNWEHDNAQTAAGWLQAYLEQLPEDSLNAMHAILYAADNAIGEGGYCEKHGVLIWRHGQHIALRIVARLLGIGTAEKPLPAGLNVSLECPICVHK